MTSGFGQVREQVREGASAGVPDLKSMSSSRAIKSSATTVLWVLVLSAGVALLAGCASAPTAMGGLPAGAPARSITTGAYPAVHDMPPPRETTVLTSEEQKKLQDELAAARARAAGATNAPANSSGGARDP